MLDRVHRLRESYHRAATALPWLDAARWEEDAPAFAAFASDPGLPSVRRVTLEPGLRGRLARDAGERRFLVRHDPVRSGPLAGLDDLLIEMAGASLPLVILHTDVELEDIAGLARSHPRLQIIVESGPAKILYFIEPLERLLRAQPNVWLCTYNLCNWLGLERLCAAGLGDRLLLGTHAPRFNAHVAMGPVVMGRLSWGEKCAIAGDNLRRLLGLAPAAPRAEEVFEPGAPFVIDSHGHSGPPGRFPVPDEEFEAADWLRFMDECGIEQLYLCPMEAIHDPGADPRERVAGLLSAAPGRFRYFEVFAPGARPEQVRRIEQALRHPAQRGLRDPACAGIKIHPSMHGVAADDDAYAPVFELAERMKATILTHSWEASATNPVQHLSLPERFERHLREHPGASLVLGHAGGRPSTIASVVELCERYRGVSVDLAGDYFDSGLVEMLRARIGPGRVLFASDVNWVDPRANLAAVLASRLTDEDAARVLRDNALRVYGPRPEMG
ncbi:MAG TPA: amidohydrolase family protein [Armatimonadota bacterium]|nr:amidohydrolase family protein [Armatimonadota bacterium]